jgi:hypothetical protein
VHHGIIVKNNPIAFVDPWGLCATAQTTQASSNPLVDLPTFSQAFPESDFIAPVVDIVLGGIEAGGAVAAGVGAGVSFLAGPEFWLLTMKLGPASILAAWDAYWRIRGGIERLGDN